MPLRLIPNTLNPTPIEILLKFSLLEIWCHLKTDGVALSTRAAMMNPSLSVAHVRIVPAGSNWLVFFSWSMANDVILWVWDSSFHNVCGVLILHFLVQRRLRTKSFKGFLIAWYGCGNLNDLKWTNSIHIVEYKVTKHLHQRHIASPLCQHQPVYGNQPPNRWTIWIGHWVVGSLPCAAVLCQSRLNSGICQWWSLVFFQVRRYKAF